MAEISKFAPLLDVPIEIEARLDGPRVRVADVLALEKGSIVMTGRRAGTNIDVYAGEALIGSGELGSANQHAIVRMARFMGRP
jgi:flagellar motor switch/type III secretory pathway protein FliN